MLLTFFIWFQTEYHHGNMHTTTFYLFFSKTLPLNAIYQCDLAAKCSLCSIRMFNPVLNNIFMSIVPIEIVAALRTTTHTFPFVVDLAIQIIFVFQ